MERRGRGCRETSSTMSEGTISEETEAGEEKADLRLEVWGECTVAVAGSFSEAAVEGFRSWAGDGWRLREADWRVEASSMAGLDAIVVCDVVMSSENEDACKDESSDELITLDYSLPK